MFHRCQIVARRRVAAAALSVVAVTGVSLMSAGSALAAERHAAPVAHASAGQRSATLTSTQIVAALTDLAQATQSLQVQAGQITASSFALAAVGVGPVPTVAAGLATLANSAATLNLQLNASATISDPVAQAAVDAAYRTYAQLSQQLYATLAAKAAVGAQVSFLGAPIAASLRANEATNDALAYSLIALLPNVAADIQSATGALEAQLNVAINAYAGVGV